MTHHITDEQIDATSADELLLKVYELLWGEHPECCGNPEAVGYFGDSPAIDCCRCPNYARLNDAQIVASLRALIKESDLMSLLGMRSAKTTPLADWSVDVFDDDEEGRTYINIRNPDDDVAATGVIAYVVGNRRTLASQVLHGFRQAFHSALTAAPTPPAQGEPKLIGWRTENFLWETDDVDKARNWEPNIGVLPIFDGDPNTNLGSAGIATIPPEQSVDLLERCAKWCDEQARSDWCGRRASDMVRAFAATTKAAQPAVPESAGVASEQVATSLTPTQIDDIINAGGYRNAAGGIYETSVYLFATDIQAAIKNATLPAVPEDVARVNQQMLEALEEVEEHLPFAWAFEHDPKLIGEEGYKAASAKVRAAIDAARKAEKGGA